MLELMDIIALLKNVKIMVLYLSFFFSVTMFLIQFESLTILVLEKHLHTCAGDTAAQNSTFSAFNSLE